jgi:hypothetical protein
MGPLKHLAKDTMPFERCALKVVVDVELSFKTSAGHLQH